MSFQQEKLDRSIEQARDIFNKYIYKTDDTVSDVQVSGYFSASRFIQIDSPSTNGAGWIGGVVECQCVDGFITGSMDESSTLTVIYDSAVRLDNVTVVQSLSNFPAPEAGVIRLVEDELYQINGFIDIGTNRIEINGNNSIQGKSGGHDGITYTGTGALFTLGSGEAMTLISLDISYDNGSAFDLDGGGNGLLFVQGNCAFIGGGELGSISNMQAVQFDNNIFAVNTDGFTFGGANNARLSFTKNTISANTGTFIDLTTGVWESIVINGNQAVNTPGGSVFLSGLASSGNITNAGLVEGNIFSGAGTYLNNITNDDLKWEFQGNKGNNGTQDSQRGASVNISSSAVTTITTGSGDAGNPIIIAGTYAEDLALRYTTTAAGRLTYIGLESFNTNVSLTLNLDPASGTNKTYNIYIAKNGTEEAGSRMQITVDSNNPGPIMTMFPVTFETDEYVEGFIENITDETNVTATTAILSTG